MSPLKVFLGGEGPNELGKHAHETPYQAGYGKGVVEALLHKVATKGFHVVGGRRWKDIKKYKAGDSRDAEERNVLGLVLEAKERGYDVVAFVRDRDGAADRPNTERQQSIEKAIGDAKQKFEGIEVVGGVAIKRLESWILAMKGTLKSEEITKTDRGLLEVGIDPKKTQSFVDVVDAWSPTSTPEDAHSLKQWLDRAKAVLA